MKRLLAIIAIVFLLNQPAFAATDIVSHSTLNTSLLSYWTLDEASGTRVDAPGTFDLTDNNTTGYNASCKQNGCADLTPNDNLSIAEKNALRYTGSNNLSVSFCFNPDTVAAGTIGLVGMYNGSATGEEWLVYRNGSSLLMAVRGSGAAVTWSGTLSAGSWYHVVATMSSSNAYQLIVNNGTPNTGSGATGASNDSLQFRIGAYGKTATGFFDGKIDEVGIWEKVLTASEITDLYNSGACLPYQASAPAGDSAPNNDIIFY